MNNMKGAVGRRSLGEEKNGTQHPLKLAIVINDLNQKG
jgi:hypothetical protein